MGKNYFRKDEDVCYDVEIHLDYMEQNNISEMEIFEAKREKGTGYFFCQWHQEVGTVGDSCGKLECSDYTPNNGKSGRCKHYGYVYENTGVKRILQLELI